MLKITLFSLLAFFSPLLTSAQVYRDAKPNLTLDCPAEEVMAGSTVTLRASVKPPLEGATFNWAVSAGQIESGQGTTAIELAIPEDHLGNVSAEVEIGGGPFYFEAIRANCAFALREPPRARLIAEGGRFSPADELEHINGFLAEFELALANDPAAQGYVVYQAQRERPAEARATLQAARQWAQKRGLTERMVHLDAGAAARTTFRYYLVPAGARPPQPDSSDLKPRIIVQADANACELNARFLDHLSAELNNHPGSFVRFVFSPDRDETDAVNEKRRRLFAVYTGRRFPSPPIENGARTGGAGEVAVYFGRPGEKEELFLLIYALKNKSVCLNCCNASDMPKNLAPAKKVKKKRK